MSESTERPAVRAQSLADIVVRLRCDACGARPAAVHLTEAAYPPDVRGDVVQGWQMLLHGVEGKPGAAD